DRLLELLAVVARVLHGDGELVDEKTEQVELVVLDRVARGADQGHVADVVAARRQPQANDLAPAAALNRARAAVLRRSVGPGALGMPVTGRRAHGQVLSLLIPGH